MMGSGYGPRWMTLRLRHQTLVDPALLHQVMFLASASSHRVLVSCNCLGGRRVMGTSADLDEARALYNDPANHARPFAVITDRARW